MKFLKYFCLILALLAVVSGCGNGNVDLENSKPSPIPPNDGILLNAGDHTHQKADEPQTVSDPYVGYCGNTMTAVRCGDKECSFMGGNSVYITDLLLNLDYDPKKVCKCLPEYTVDTEFYQGYGVNLSGGYARCDKGQAELTGEQVDKLREILYSVFIVNE